MKKTIRAIYRNVSHHVHQRPAPFLKLGYLGGVKAKSPFFDSFGIIVRNHERRIAISHTWGLYTFTNPVVDGSNHGKTGKIVHLENCVNQIFSSVFVTNQDVATIPYLRSLNCFRLMNIRFLNCALSSLFLQVLCFLW